MRIRRKIEMLAMESAALLLLPLTVISQSPIAGPQEQGNPRHFSSHITAGTRSSRIDWRSLRGEKTYERALRFYNRGRYGEAAAAYEKSCGGSNAAACTNLGFLYRFGQGVRRNYIRAAELYELGCGGGNAPGCTNLGLMYWNNVLAKDEMHAAKLFQQGCSGGDGGGCLALGYMYENGYGVARDENEAADLYGQACYGGNLEGCNKFPTSKH